jgi:nitrogen-specific signal transduction histidine kinase
MASAPSNRLLTEQVIEAVFDSMQSGVILLAPDYRILFFNQTARHSSKMLYGREIRVGENFLNFERDGDEAAFEALKQNFKKAINEKRTIASERGINYHRSTRWIKSEYTPVFHGSSLVGVSLRFIDSTERKEREDQIRRQNEQLRDIAWMQSHLTRQPLATILGLVNILDKKSLTDDNKKIIGMLEETVGKLDQVIRDIVIQANR